MGRKCLRQERLGLHSRTKSGILATVVDYSDANNMTVLFETGGTTKVGYANFMLGIMYAPTVIEYFDDYVKVVNPNTKFSTLLDKEDLHLIEGHVLQQKDGYACIQPSATCRQFVHKLIMNGGVGTVTDHINGDRADNRKANLRVCSQAQNARNARLSRRSSSGYKGVSWDCRGRWLARIRVDGELKHLGRFDCKIEAAKVYNVAAVKYFGEFAKLNDV